MWILKGSTPQRHNTTVTTRNEKPQKGFFLIFAHVFMVCAFLNKACVLYYGIVFLFYRPKTQQKTRLVK